MEQKKIKTFVIKNLKWIILFICIVFFLVIVEDVLDEEIEQWDILGYNFVSTYLISDFTTPIAKFITNFGGPIFFIICTISLFVVIKNRKLGISIMTNLAIAASLNIILKNILQRPRPT